MDLIPIPPLSVQALANRGITPEVRLAIQVISTCLRDACRSVVEDCDEERYDDTTSEGQLRWRRCRNQVKEWIDEGLIVGLEEARADVTDNALKVRIGDTAISFYSARNGIDHPDLTGGRRTKKTIVTEMQQQLAVLTEDEPPTQLVVIYEADADGLAAAVVGMLSSAKSWEWRFSIYEREGLGVLDIGSPSTPDVPTYDTEPEPEIGDFEMLDDDADDEDRSANDDG